MLDIHRGRREGLNGLPRSISPLPSMETCGLSPSVSLMGETTHERSANPELLVAMPDLHERIHVHETNPFERQDLREAWEEGWKAFWAGLPQPEVRDNAGKEIRAFMRGHEDAQMYEE